MKKELETGVWSRVWKQGLGTGAEKKIGNKGWELRLGKGVKKQKRCNRG